MLLFSSGHSLRKLGLRQTRYGSLLISATGTGKTYLSAFDIRNFKAKSILFIVHRENILIDAQQAFKNVFGADFKSAIFSGSNRDIAGYDNIFATIQSLSRDHHLTQFSPEAFDYIVKVIVQVLLAI
nr:DEAD/DEAH box helicase family protein [Prolinoborus fasciculus]